MKRIVGFVAVAATVATLMAGPVAAQATSERILVGPEPFVNPGLLNPCTGEVVAITGEIRGFFQVVQTPTGQTFTNNHFFVHGTGVGSEGNTYIFEENQNFAIPGDPPLTVTVPILMISQGSGDNFTLNQVVHVSPNGEVHEGVAEPVCRG